jgi:hypothetical protein
MEFSLSFGTVNDNHNKTDNAAAKGLGQTRTERVSGGFTFRGQRIIYGYISYREIGKGRKSFLFFQTGAASILVRKRGFFMNEAPCGVFDASVFAVLPTRKPTVASMNNKLF